MYSFSILVLTSRPNFGPIWTQWLFCSSICINMMNPEDFWVWRLKEEGESSSERGWGESKPDNGHCPGQEHAFKFLWGETKDRRDVFMLRDKGNKGLELWNLITGRVSTQAGSGQHFPTQQRLRKWHGHQGTLLLLPLGLLRRDSLRWPTVTSENVCNIPGDAQKCLGSLGASEPQCKKDLIPTKGRKGKGRRE